jgi:hypothetical protein
MTTKSFKLSKKQINLINELDDSYRDYMPLENYCIYEICFDDYDNFVKYINESTESTEITLNITQINHIICVLSEIVKNNIRMIKYKMDSKWEIKDIYASDFDFIYTLKTIIDKIKIVEVNNKHKCKTIEECKIKEDYVCSF